MVEISVSRNHSLSVKACNLFTILLSKLRVWYVPYRCKHKIDNPYLVTFLMRTPIFEWYVVWYASKIGCQKDMYSKEIGLCAQNTITISGLLVNIIVGGGGMRPFNEGAKSSF